MIAAVDEDDLKAEIAKVRKKGQRHLIWKYRETNRPKSGKA
jgi:hypothetical protein